MINKINKRIEIVRARDVHFSSMGLKSGQMIQHFLSKHYRHVGLSTVADKNDLEELVRKKPDLVFLGLKRIKDRGEFIWLSEYLDDHGINYSGSNKPAMELDMHKADAKALVQRHGIATADFFTARPRQFAASRQLPLGFPLFIKPHDQGGGMGIGPDSIARDMPSFVQKVQSIYDNYEAPSLVEKYLEGREFSVALLGHGYKHDLMAMPVELITQPNEFGDRILGEAVKHEDNERAIYISDKPTRDRLAELGRSVYEVLGGRDYGRIDIRMDNHGKPNFMEANLTPGIASNDFVSYFTMACQLNQNMSYESMILRIVELGLARQVHHGQDVFELGALPTPLFPTAEPVFSHGA